MYLGGSRRCGAPDILLVSTKNEWLVMWIKTGAIDWFEVLAENETLVSLYALFPQLS